MTSSDSKTFLPRVHQHLGSMLDLLGHLSKGITADTIMTPWNLVLSVQAESNKPEVKTQAKDLMDRFQFSGIPLISSGRMVGVYSRHELTASPRYSGVRDNFFIAPDLGLIDVLRHMREHEQIVLAVGSIENPLGWLTYADFSKRPFRVLLFTILAEVEYLMAEALDRAHPDGAWVDLLPGNEAVGYGQASLRKRQKEAKEWDTMMPPTTFAEIGHLIEGIRHSAKARSILGESSDLADRLLTVPDLRNRVSHVVKPIIAGPGQIKSVAKQIENLLRWVEAWSCRLTQRSHGGAANG